MIIDVKFIPRCQRFIKRTLLLQRSRAFAAFARSGISISRSLFHAQNEGARRRCVSVLHRHHKSRSVRRGGGFADHTHAFIVPICGALPAVWIGYGTTSAWCKPPHAYRRCAAFTNSAAGSTAQADTDFRCFHHWKLTQNILTLRLY